MLASKHDNHESFQDSSHLPSSAVHIFYVTIEKCRAHKPLEYHRVSETADGWAIAVESVSTIHTSRIQTMVSEKDTVLEPLKTCKQYGLSSIVYGKGIDYATDLLHCIMSSCNKPGSLIDAHDKLIKNNGKLICCLHHWYFMLCMSVLTSSLRFNDLCIQPNRFM